MGDDEDGDIIGRVQDRFVALSKSMFTALGLLQRDAPSMSATEDGFEAMKQRLVDAIVHESNEIDRYCAKLQDTLGTPSDTASDGPLEPLAQSMISEQRLKIAAHKQNLVRLENAFKDMALARLRGS